MNPRAAFFRSFHPHTRKRGMTLDNQRLEKAGHLGYLDGWRGLAIALVLVDHFFGSRLFDMGEMGVDTFFVLSGMLMSNILFVKRSPLDLFYKRRISRIFPALLVYLFAVYLRDFVLRHHIDWREIISTATFIRTYYPISPGLWDLDIPVGHLW